MLTIDDDHDTTPRGDRLTDEEVARPKAELRFNVPREEYDGIDAVNWSRLKVMLRSPRHYQHALTSRYVDSAAKKRGRAVHLAILEPARFAAECVVFTGKQRRGKAWDKFAAKHEGKEILSQREHDEVLQLATAVRGSPEAMALLSNGRSEATIEWSAYAPNAGAVEGWKFDLKSRLDFISAQAIADLKTTRNSSPIGFQGESHRYQYLAQASFYSDAYEAATGKRLPYHLVAVETESPHVVTVFVVPEELLAIGRKTYRECLERLAFCTRENSWPAYAEGVQVLTLPPWAAQSNDEDLSELDLVIDHNEAKE